MNLNNANHLKGINSSEKKAHAIEIEFKCREHRGITLQIKLNQVI
jgi:hypothetical protein